MKVPFGDLLRRVNITGLSIPLGGAQWTVEQSEQEKARRVIIYLQDRRVLYNHYSLEVPEACIRSVEDVRQTLRTNLQDARPGSDLANCLRFMVAACRKFLDDVQDPARRRRHYYGRLPLDPEFTEIDTELGELRGVIGVYLALMAAAYKLDIPSELASILPGLPDDIT